MFVLPPEDRASDPEVSVRRFLNRAEAATLLGMILTVFSLFLVWKNEAISVPLPAMFAGRTQRTGLGMPVFWPLLLGASLSSTLLLWTPNERTRLPLLVAHLAFSLTCFVVTMANFALEPGVLMALVGSVLLIYGAVDRYREVLQPKHRN